MSTKRTEQKLLIIDDEPDILALLSYNLTKEGYEVYCATDGEEGVNMVRKCNPNLVLLDMMMPKMNGIETCLTIRNDFFVTQPIIAFLTSRGEEYSKELGIKAGADEYITKPIRPKVLLQIIDSLLQVTA